MEDLIKKSDKELSKDLADKAEALRVFRFGISGSKVKNMREGRTIKRTIAQIQTIISARRIAAQSAK